MDLYAAVDTEIKAGKPLDKIALSLPEADRNWIPQDLSLDIEATYNEITQHATGWVAAARVEMKGRLWLGFAGLCLLSGSVWLLDEVAPPVFGGPAQVAIHDGFLAGVFGLLSLKFGGRERTSARMVFELVLAGVALLGLPAIVGAGAAGKVSSLDGVLVFCMVPAIVVFLTAQRVSGFGDTESPLRLLLPALAGLGGAALILPFTLPQTTAGKLWLIAIVASASFSAWAAIRMHRLLQGMNMLRAAAVLCASAAILSWTFAAHAITLSAVPDARLLWLEAARILGIDAPVMLLTVYLLGGVNPVAFSGRFLLITLVTIVESYVIERPQVEWTTFAGAVLMAGAAMVLLRPEEPGDARQDGGISL